MSFESARPHAKEGRRCFDSINDNSHVKYDMFLFIVYFLSTFEIQRINIASKIIRLHNMKNAGSLSTFDLF